MADENLGPFGSIEDQKEFEAWTRGNDLVREYKAMERDTLLFMAVFNFWWYQRVNDQWGKTLELLREVGDQGRKAAEALPVAEQVGKLSMYVANMDKLDAFERRKQQLQSARLRGAQARRDDGRYKEVVELARIYVEMGRAKRDLAQLVLFKLKERARTPGAPKPPSLRQVQRHISAAIKKGDISV